MLYYYYSVFYSLIWVILVALNLLVTPWVWLFTGKLTPAPSLEIERAKDLEYHRVEWGEGFWLSRRVTWQDL
jgi:hypothetical protein